MQSTHVPAGLQRRETRSAAGHPWNCVARLGESEVEDTGGVGGKQQGNDIHIMCSPAAGSQAPRFQKRS